MENYFVVVGVISRLSVVLHSVPHRLQIFCLKWGRRCFVSNSVSFHLFHLFHLFQGETDETETQLQQKKGTEAPLIYTLKLNHKKVARPNFEF